MILIIIAGGDEAGRGAVIGPLVVSVISIQKGQEKHLSKIGVRDSKLLTRRKREFLYDEIHDLAEEVKTYEIKIDEINRVMQGGISINELEALHFARLIDSLEKNPHSVFIDSPDVISERFGMRVSMFCQKQMKVDGVKAKKGDPKMNGDHIKVISEHKADARYPVVSGASIIAKVTRDREIDKIRDELDIEIGSGYPSDQLTIDAIRESLGDNTLTPYLRAYWKTLKVIRQLKMTDFLE